MTARDLAKRAFLEANGWGNAQICFLAGDASGRSYDRARLPDGHVAVIMDAPPEKGEDVTPFVVLSDFLTSIGLSAPQILAAAPDSGFLLIEDLGNALFARLVKQQPDLEEKLYTGAVDLLANLQCATPPPLATYSAPIMSDLAALAADWYLTGATGNADNAFRAHLSAAMNRVIRPLEPDFSIVVLRDYHAENLLWLPDRIGVARVGLLDFQDAMIGHPAYDVVSVLQDARRDVDPDVEARMQSYFIDRTRAYPDNFRAAYAVMGAQRNLRILGVFARLCLRDGKPRYVDLIPRVWGLVQRNLEHPALTEVAKLVTENLPPPDQLLLETLRSKCANPLAP